MGMTSPREPCVEDVPEGFGVRSLALSHFRNYASETLDLSPGFNVLAGPNAQGKTNLLESLHLLATTRLLRGQRDVEAILQGQTEAHVQAELLGPGTQIAVQLRQGTRKRATLNGLGLPRAADLLGRLPCVCVSAADLEIVRGQPSERRLFFDLELSSLYPAYLRALSLYKRALEQRNALLRQSRERFVSPEAFEPWEAQLATQGVTLRRFRREALERLEPATRDVHALMGEGECLTLEYLSGDETRTEQDLLDKLAQNRDSDVARGGTGTGPHRDDLSLKIEGKEVRLYGSGGQQRTAVIALKMGAFGMQEQILGAPPLLLLDDILSDLDERRRANLVEMVLRRARQAVLTCTEASAAGREILERAQLFEIRAGRVLRG